MTALRDRLLLGTLIGLCAGLATAVVAVFQGVDAATAAWRFIASFGLVCSFQWSFLTAWEILGDPPTAGLAKDHQGVA